MTQAVPSTKVAELYGLPTFQPADWKTVAAAQHCPFLHRKCLKNRKSEPELTIGTGAAGIAMCLGSQADTRVELQTLLDQIEAKLPQSTLLAVGGGAVPISEIADIEADES